MGDEGAKAPEAPLPAAADAHLAVIIPHLNDVTRLARCLAAIAPETAPDVEIVVVDNGSDPPPDIGAHPGVRLVTEARRGAAAARNRGVAETTAPLLLFLDADCVPAPGWLTEARRLDPELVTGGRITLFDETPQPRSGAEAFETAFAFRQHAYVAKGFAVTANLAVPRRVFAEVGPFRTGVAEDLDWCQRAGALGHAVRYEAALAVQHPTRADWPALSAKWRRLTGEAFALRDARLRGRLLWALLAALMPMSVVAHAPRLLRHPALSWRERMRGLGTLTRLRLLRSRWMLTQALQGHI